MRIKQRLKIFPAFLIMFSLTLQLFFPAVGSITAVADEANSDYVMKYMSGGTWKDFDDSVITNSSIDAVRIQSPYGASYYLEYRTLNSGASGFYSPVKSNDRSEEAYAGSSGKPIQKLAISVYSNEQVKLTSGIVVMYRAYVGNAWLPWVSNADAQSMSQVKTKYGLTGELDTASGNAGATGKEIRGIEIRIFEEGSVLSSSDFDGNEVSLSASYMIGNDTSWTTFSKTVMSQMDGLKLQTSQDKPYRLEYKTWNHGKSAPYSPVSSTDSSEYAGKPGERVEQFGISVYSNDQNQKLHSGIVVMYRAYVDGAWLPWVSNADPEHMESVQSKFGLGGTLDTSSFYAGKSGKILEGIEIRVFEGEMPDSEITGLSGNEYEIKKYYSINNLIKIPFNGRKETEIDCLWLETSDLKPYYLEYRVATKSGWYSYVSSRDKNKYAGLAGKRITKLDIRVCSNDGTRIKSGVTVMYRVKTQNTGWLPWVSNADPEWMRLAQVKYNLDGTLDYNSYFAGLSNDSVIKGVEIRVFEENDLNAPITPSGDSKIISTPFIYQMNDYPTGCESVSTVMALNYWGVNISVDTFIKNYLKMGDSNSFDPNICFGGDPRDEKGMGCYAPVIMKALNKILAGKKFKATSLDNKSLEYLCSEYIDNDIPVIMWATRDMLTPYEGKTIHYNGRTIKWIAPEHCLLLVGYDENNYIFRDPMKTRSTTFYPKASVEVAYEGLHKQAIVIERTSSSSEPGTSEPSAPQNKPVSNPQEYVKPNNADKGYMADPIDLYSGSHIIDVSLLSLFGGQQLSVTAGYNSGRLSEGALGIGWYHNYEKHIAADGTGYRVYDNPGVYSYYEPAEGGKFSCVSKSRQGYLLTVSETGFTLDLGGESTESYDSSGRLTAVTDKQGFVTQIAYSENLITVTDTVSGKHIYMQYGSDGLITRIYDDGGRETKLNYENDYLIGITDVDNNRLSYTYSSNGRIESGTDGAGVCYFKNVYDNEGRVTEQTDGASPGKKTYITYKENGVREVKDRTEAVSTHVFNEDGQLISYTDANGNTTQYTYDENLNTSSVTDPLGHTSSAVYNSLNKPVSITDRNGCTTLYTYDTNGNVTGIIHPQKGDINSDGFVDITDLVRFKKAAAAYSAVTNQYNTDMNSDGSINSLDLAGLRIMLLENMNIRSTESFTYNEYNQLLTYTDLRGTVTVNTYDSARMLSAQKVGEREKTVSYENGLLVSESDFKGNITRYNYNGLEQLTSETDSQNRTTEYSYDNRGNLLSVTDPTGAVTSYTYDGNSQKRSETDARGYTTWYTYTGNMKLSGITLPENGHITYRYDGEDRLSETIDQKENISSVKYDAAGRKVAETDALKNKTEYEYDDAGNIIKITNAADGVTTTTYDNEGNAVSVTDPAGNTVYYTYDAAGRVIKSVNAAGGVTLNTYNSAGDLLRTTDPLGNTVSYTYDIYGNKLTEKDANGNITRFTYDEHNKLLTVTNALGQTSVNTYDSRDLLTSSADPAGNTVYYGYDNAGRLTTQTDPNGHTVTTEYDAAGNVCKVIDAKGNTVSTTDYNGENKPASVTDASGSVTVNGYDIAGNLSSVTDTEGGKTVYVCDAAGRVTSVTDMNGGESRAVYNSLGSITSLTDAGGASTHYTYDSSGRLTNESTSSGGTVSYGYNSLSLKETLTNARNQTRTFTYDLSGRITGYTSPEGTASFTYDGNGNVLTASDQNGTVTREYDALNRVTKYTDVNGRTVQYEYDTAGRLSALIYPDGTKVLYSYDDAGNLLSVSDMYENPPGSLGGLIIGGSFDDVLLGTVSYTYDENNNCTSVTKPDGSVTTTVYDSAQRVSSTVERTANGDIIIGYEYSYDSLGRISSETLLAENIRYEYAYDSLSRVISRTAVNLETNESATENYTYDQAGNITSSVKGDTSEQFTYDENNRLVSFGNTAITYDADGNMISGLGMTLSFDSANRLTSAGGNTYTYDVENIRVKNLCGDSETEYTYDTTAELSRLLYKVENDSTVTKYIYGIGLIGEVSESGAKIYHFDYRGSTAAITDKDGEITDTFSYDTYGRLENRTGTSAIIFLYNGRDGVVTDSNGLLYMRARYYSPVLKRFVNADIIAGVITDPVTLNRYSYANGNPVSNIDPFGLSAERGNKTQKYDKEYYESKAYEKIKKNSVDILLYSWYYEVDPNIVAGAIFVEQYYNYDWVDVLTDWIAFYGVIDMSVGLGQIRLSTAKFLEEKGYVPKTSAEEGGWNIPFIGFVHGTETMAREKRLENDSWNIIYAAAYIRALSDIWREDFPEIDSRPDILGSLYNLGHEKSPRNNPEPNWFGEKVDYFYNLMDEALS